MLVRTWTIVDIHAKLFCEVLSGVAIAHDDALQIALEKSDNVELSLANEGFHASLRAPHVVVNAEVDRPDTSSDQLAVLVIGLIIISWEAKICHASADEL